MGYAELIQTLEQFPEDKQAEVLELAKCLAHRVKRKQSAQETLAEASLARWINNPLGVENFQPLSREEANAR